MPESTSSNKTKGSKDSKPETKPSSFLSKNKVWLAIAGSVLLIALVASGGSSTAQITINGTDEASTSLRIDCSEPEISKGSIDCKQSYSIEYEPVDATLSAEFVKEGDNTELEVVKESNGSATVDHIVNFSKDIDYAGQYDLKLELKDEGEVLHSRKVTIRSKPGEDTIAKANNFKVEESEPEPEQEEEKEEPKPKTLVEKVRFRVNLDNAEVEAFDLTGRVNVEYLDEETKWDDASYVRDGIKNMVEVGESLFAVDEVEEIFIRQKAIGNDGFGNQEEFTVTRFIVTKEQFNKFNWDKLEFLPVLGQIESTFDSVTIDSTLRYEDEDIFYTP